MTAKYDKIGVDYANLRRPDPRIAAHIDAALGQAETVLNVGAGTGSYEPQDRVVTALDPSVQMIRQRAQDAAPVVQGMAENLPFADDSFDAAMGVLTIHHWTNPVQGLAEMARVSRGPVVLLTYDPAFRDFWLLDYLPELAALDEAQMPAMPRYRDWLGAVEVTSVPIPHDCQDGFLCAYWRRPEAYLDPKIRAAISSFWALDGLEPGLQRLATDLENGVWAARYGPLMDLPELDCGYRLVRSL